ncbi:hypothetical protein ACU8KG_28930 (plasmid) [Rhizobium leguminosarum]
MRRQKWQICVGITSLTSQMRSSEEAYLPGRANDRATSTMSSRDAEAAEAERDRLAG